MILKKYSTLGITLLYSIIAFLCYGNVINGPFLFDDQLNIELNTHIQSFASWKKIFTSSSIQGAFIETSNFFRPIKTLIYTTLYHFFEFNVKPYHLTSIIIHIFNSVLTFLLIRKFNIQASIAFLSGALFLTHPIMTEAVSYVSGIADPIGTLFILLMLFFFDRYYKKQLKRYFFGTIISFILACLSKENMVIGFLLLWIYSLVKSQTNKNSNYIVMTVTFIAFLYITLKFTLLDFTGNNGLTEAQNAYTTSLFVRLNTFLHIIWDYVKLIIYPKDLYLEKPYTAFAHFFWFRGLFGLSVVTLFISTIYHSFKKNKLLFFSLNWIVIAMAPVSGIVPLNAIYLEHWLYLPMIGIVLSIAIITNNLAKNKLFITSLCIVIFLLSYRTHLRNQQWANPISFYLNEIKYAPNFARIHNNLAMEYADINQFKKAIFYFNNALKLSPNHAEIYHNLGNTYLQLGDTKLAIRYLEESIKRNPNFIYSYIKLYYIYLNKKNKEKTQYYLNKSNELFLQTSK